jgi:hypothetical protein
MSKKKVLLVVKCSVYTYIVLVFADTTETNFMDNNSS